MKETNAAFVSPFGRGIQGLMCHRWGLRSFRLIHNRRGGGRLMGILAHRNSGGEEYVG